MLDIFCFQLAPGTRFIIRLRVIYSMLASSKFFAMLLISVGSVRQLLFLVSFSFLFQLTGVHLLWIRLNALNLPLDDLAVFDKGGDTATSPF